jgi:hypothetical protein
MLKITIDKHWINKDPKVENVSLSQNKPMLNHPKKNKKNKNKNKYINYIQLMVIWCHVYIVVENLHKEELICIRKYAGELKKRNKKD